MQKQKGLILFFFPLVLPECWLYYFLTADQQAQLSGLHGYLQVPRFTSPCSATRKNSCSCSTFTSRLSESKTLLESLLHPLTNQRWLGIKSTIRMWGYCESKMLCGGEGRQRVLLFPK